MERVLAALEAGKTVRGEVPRDLIGLPETEVPEVLIPGPPILRDWNLERSTPAEWETQGLTHDGLGAVNISLTSAPEPASYVSAANVAGQ